MVAKGLDKTDNPAAELYPLMASSVSALNVPYRQQTDTHLCPACGPSRNCWSS